MKDLHIQSSPEVEKVFHNYPDWVRMKLFSLRQLIFEVAMEIEGLEKIEETLKWGEPSYLVKKGSTIRIDWKEKKPDQYAIYFKCTSKLVPTFKTVYPNKFHFEGNRAIVFKMIDKLPVTELKKCIKAGLTYHEVKQFPLLGIK